MKVVVVNDCGHVMEDLIPYLSSEFQIVFLERSRSLWSKTVGIFYKILRVEGDVYHVNYGLQDAYLVSKFQHLDILHLHGSDIRSTLHNRKYGWIVKHNLRNAKKVLYVTPDMKQTVESFRSDAIYLPTPIKTDVFLQKQIYHIPPKIVYFKLPYEILPKIISSNTPITVMEKRQPYNLMPSILRSFDVYIDRFSIRSYSKTCLEAMSCGLATIDYRHKNHLLERIVELHDQQTVKRIGLENRRLVQENHDAKKIAEKLARIWRTFM